MFAYVTPPERALIAGGCYHLERNGRILYRWKGSLREGPAHRRVPPKPSLHLYQSPTPIKSKLFLKSKLTKDREHRANPATIGQGAIRDCRRVDQRGYEVDDNNAFLPSSLARPLLYPGYSNCTLHSTGNLLRLCAFSYLTRLHLALVKHIDNVVAVLSSRPIRQLMYQGISNRTYRRRVHVWPLDSILGWLDTNAMHRR